MPQQLRPDLLKVIAGLLHYSFKDIRFKYDDLTDQEQSLCTPEQFDEIAHWVKRQLRER